MSESDKKVKIGANCNSTLNSFFLKRQLNLNLNVIKSDFQPIWEEGAREPCSANRPVQVVIEADSGMSEGLRAGGGLCLSSVT